MPMIRACRVATAVVGLFLKVWAVLVGFAVVAAFVPSPAPDSGPRSERVGPALSGETVTVRIPEGELAGHLTVVDESGRPLAVLSCWRNGMASVTANRGGDVAVGCFFTAEGTACLELIGAVRQASIDFTPAGDLRVAQTVRGGRVHPASAPGVGARMGPRPSAGK
jgi:hypothetical protein